MKTFLRRPSVNPILVKELRSRMRGVRPYAILTIFLLLMIGMGYGINQLVASQARFGATVLSPQVGQALFSGLALCELFLVVFLAPALTSSAISAEREQLTYDMLVATPLRPIRILWGKLVAALSYLFLLIFAAVPIFSVVLVFGGVAPRDMAKVLILLVLASVMFGAAAADGPGHCVELHDHHAAAGDLDPGQHALGAAQHSAGPAGAAAAALP
jgi:ABC-2 type transport system permease protein